MKYFKNCFILFLIIFAGCAGLEPKKPQNLADSMVSKIQTYIPQVSLAKFISYESANLAGYYSGKPFSCIINHPCGQDLYIFPDNTYYILRWDTKRPMVIIDSGIWNYRNDLVKLKSDKTLKLLSKPKNTIFLPLNYLDKSNKKTLLLLGIQDSYQQLINEFKKVGGKPARSSKTNYTFALDLRSYNRKETISATAYKTLKKSLFKMFWPN